MGYGSLHKGLLKKIVSIIHEDGDEKSYDTDMITVELEKQNWWKPGEAETPERTVNSYFSQNPRIFERLSPNRYRLKRAYWTKKPTFKIVDDTKDTEDVIPLIEFDELIKENRLLKDEIVRLKDKVKTIKNLCD